MEEIIRKLKSEDVPYKKVRKLTTIYIIEDDKVVTKEELCDVITVEGTGYIPIKY